MAPEDQTLVRLALDGQREAFGALVERYSGLVYSLILEQVRRREDVEDLVQEAFCQAYQQLPDLRRPASFPAWLAQITRNTALTWLRREGHRTQVEALGEQWTWPASPLTPDRLLESQEEAELLWGVLDRLPATQRQVVVLFYLENCTYREIARFLGKSVATVRWHLFQSERRLGKELGQRLGEQWQPRRTDRRYLREKVLAALPVGMWASTKGEAVPWWSLDRFPRPVWWLTHGTLARSFIGSVLLHLLGLGSFEYWWRGEVGPASGVQVVFQGMPKPAPQAAGRADPQALSQPPGPAQDVLTLPALQGLLSAPPLDGLRPGVLEQAMVPKVGDLALAIPRSSGKVRFRQLHSPRAILSDLAAEASRDSLALESLDLLRVEDLDRAGTHHAVIIPDTLDRRQLQGYLHFTGVRVHGSGSYTAPGHALADLARFLSDHTRLQVRIQNPHLYTGFLSSELLTYPIHFLFQDGGLPGWQDRQVAHFDPEERALLGQYLRQGGFLYVEGEAMYLRGMVQQVRQALADQGRLIEIPLGHSLYHAFYDFNGGFPGEAKRQVALDQGQSWYYPVSYDLADGDHPLGMWGVELAGEVVALFNDNGLLSYWPEEVWDQEPEEDKPVKSLRLMAATNVVAYALTRPHGLAIRRTPFRWQLLAGPPSR